LINTVEVLLCMRLIISEVFESWKSVQRDVRRKQQQHSRSVSMLATSGAFKADEAS